MKKNRTVELILPAQEYDMGGMPILQPFPTQKIEQIDPFLLLHHAKVKVPTHLSPDKAGVSPHPHRGFSPVSFIFKGGVHHRDSRGNDSVIYEGGTQWMNAGMGIMHSERPPMDIHERGGIQELIQLWVNTPAAHKMDQPQYFPLTAEDTPVVKSEDGKSEVKVIAGNLESVKGPIPTFRPVNAFVITAKKDGRIEIPIPESHNAFIYLLDGQLNVEGFGLVDGHNAVKFNNDGDGIRLTAIQDTRALMMTGEPINEKVVSHGPFVMNSESQIMEAMRDYRMGKMGILIEE
jgi:quercetin 2,3-dioxygenase